MIGFLTALALIGSPSFPVPENEPFSLEGRRVSPAPQTSHVIWVPGATNTQKFELERYLGYGYTVVPLKPPKFEACVIIEQRQSDYDTYVMALKNRLAEDAREGNKVFIYIPPLTTEEDRIFLGPLAKQAAREIGFPVIESDGKSSFAELVGEALIDPVLEKKDWKLVSFDSQQIDEGPAANAIDGRTETYWHTQYDPTSPKPPHEIVVDMGKSQTVSAMRYVPRQDGGVNGRVKDFEFYLSSDGKSWSPPVLSKTLDNTSKASRFSFPSQSARYFRFVAKSEVNGGAWSSAAEIDVLRAR